MSADLWEGFNAALDPETITGPVWDEPVPLNPRRELPVFPVHALPDWLSGMVAGVAEETQTPVDLAGCLALAVLATAAAWAGHGSRAGALAGAGEPLHRRGPAPGQPEVGRVRTHDRPAPRR